ncbi:MAG: putative outer membrane protein pmp20 precursor, partial [Ramlibacter sp.]|nr:putative outer membrane protein pmp20 precursor [Ramlibacter sp.]
MPDADRLLQDLQDQRNAGRLIEIVRIEADADGIAVISETLAARSGITAVHVLGHGTEGRVQLGSAWLDAAALDARGGEIAGWRAALGAEADLLLYGCEVAGSADGERLLADLADLTGADVAGSTDVTGALASGGDWLLEVSTGRIDAVGALSSVAQSEWKGLLATYTVTNSLDLTIVGTLRWAITQANASAGADIIVLPTGTFQITQLGGDDSNLLGDLDITDDVTIQGDGAGNTIVMGSGTDRVFDIRGGNVSFSDLTITGGGGVNMGGGINLLDGASTVTLDRVVVEGNEAELGGGIYSVGTLVLRDVLIDGNQATGSGLGGGLVNDGTMTLIRTTVSNNQAVIGGGIYSKSGSLTLENSTVSGNTATIEGGGIYSKSSGQVTSSTIAFNSAATGGGVSTAGSASLTFKGTILADNTGGNSNEAQQSQGYNLDTDNTAGLLQATDLHPASAGLAALADNGGFAPTHALLAGSVAVDAGAPDAPATDQRGEARDGMADIGSFEFQDTSPTISVIPDQVTLEDTPTVSIAFVVGDAETAAADLVVTVSSGDTALLAPGGMLLGGSGANRTLTLTPVANAKGGPVTVTVMVSDGSRSTSTTFTLTVTSVNDAPEGADGTITIDEDGAHVLTVADFGFTDAADGDTLSAVRITSLPGAGTLTHDGVAVTAGSLILATDIAAGKLVFTPPADANGNALASFGFKVLDTGGTADGGLDEDATANVLTFNVTPVDDDAPVHTVPGAQTVAEDTVLAIGGLSVADADGDLSATRVRVANGSLTVDLSGGATIIGGANGSGSLTLSGTQAQINAALATLQYQGDQDFFGTDTLTVRSIDGPGRPTIDRVDITVTPVNDLPTTSDVALGSVNEDSGALLITSAQLLANAIDVDGTPLTVSAVTVTAGSGTLTDNGDGTWTFTPAANFNGTVTFGYSITSGGDTIAGTASLVVIPVADLPTTSNVTLGPVAEDSGAIVITTAQLLANATDGDGTPLSLSGVTITSVAGSGTLTDNGDGTWTFTPA